MTDTKTPTGVPQEKMEDIGFCVEDMTNDQLGLLRNKIDQLLFERSLGGNEMSMKLVDLPDGEISLEISQSLRKLLDENAEKIAQAMEKLRSVNRSLGETDNNSDDT